MQSDTRCPHCHYIFKRPFNAGKPWSECDKKWLVRNALRMKRKGTNATVAVEILAANYGRSPGAIYARLCAAGVLDPTVGLYETERNNAEV